jgi:hypothetical protein
LPYTFKGRTYNSFQSGNSLVHPDFRGKGIFQKLLNYLDTNHERLAIDFLVGFPVEESKNGFIRNQWENILNLEWHVKIINPFSFLFPCRQEKLLSISNQTMHPIEESALSFRLSKDSDFSNWRKDYSQKEEYFCFSFTKNNNSANFILKFSKRKKYINELTIGDFQCNSWDMNFIREAFNTLTYKVRSLKFISILTIAINEHSTHSLLTSLAKSGFRKANKKIYFIVKDFIGNSDLHNPALWTLYRSDIDTW